MRSFLAVFENVLHAAEVAATLAAPIIATHNQALGFLIAGATQSAISVEAAITTPGSGSQKQAAVAASTQITVNTINSILASQGKPPLPSNTTDVVVQEVVAVVANMNAIKTAVLSAPPVPLANPAPAA